MAYNYRGFQYARPYELLLSFLKTNIHGQSIDDSALQLSNGHVRLQKNRAGDYWLRIKDASEEELDALKKIRKHQFLHRDRFKTFNKISIRLEVPTSPTSTKLVPL